MLSLQNAGWQAEHDVHYLRVQGLQEGGGTEGDNNPGAHELERGPNQIALSNKTAIKTARADLTVEISVKTFLFFLVKTFFFWRSLDFGRKNSRNFGEDLFFWIFSVCFGHHKTEGAHV